MVESDLKLLGSALRAARKAKKKILQDVADAVGVSAQAVGQWERGENGPTAANLKIIGDFLEFDVSAAMAGRYEPKIAGATRQSSRPYTPLPAKIIKSRNFKFYVKDWREFMGVSVNDAARALGLSEGQYEVLEYYPINFTMAQVVELADLFGVRGDQFWFPPPKNRPASSPATRDTASKRRASK